LIGKNPIHPLSRRSVDFFKKQAKKHDTQYQKMIRRLLDLYVTRQQRQVSLPESLSPFYQLDN